MRRRALLLIISLVVVTPAFAQAAKGPSDEERAKGKTYLWGVARDLNGNRVESRLQTPAGYTTTALAALNIAQKILDGNFQPGFQTPAKAYGADLVLEIDGVTRQDVA